MVGRASISRAIASHDRRADPGLARERPDPRRAKTRLTSRRNPDRNSRLTGIAASFVLPLALSEVVTVALGVRSVINLHVTVGLALLGPVLLKLASVTYRMASYYRGASGYAQRGKPAVGLRLLGGALALSFLSMLASGLALIVGPSGVHSAARSTHEVSAYVVVLLLIGHLAVHVRPAVRLAAADIRPRTPKVRGARSRWLALLVSLTLGGVLALLLGGRGATYLHHYYPSYSAQWSSTPAHPVVAATRATTRARP
jgi:hypothetical protein